MAKSFLSGELQPLPGSRLSGLEGPDEEAVARWLVRPQLRFVRRDWGRATV